MFTRKWVVLVGWGGGANYFLFPELTPLERDTNYLTELLSIIKGVNSPVMTDSMRNLIIPENHFAFHLNLREASFSKKKKTKRATAKNKGADQSAQPRRLISAFVVRTCIKASFHSGSYEDLNHGSSTSRTTFC